MELSKFSSLLQNNGIVGAGGAGFPTYAKLSEKAEVILLNCAECEPLLKLHRQVLELKAREILIAFEAVRTTVNAKEAVVCVKKEYSATVEALEEYIKDYPNIRIHFLKNSYPMGDEVVLIYEATGKVVAPGGLPIEEGVAVFNVETMLNVFNALTDNKPVTEKYVTVTGAVNSPVTVKVPIGTRIDELVKMAGGETVDKPVYILGGPMMGSFGSKFQPVTKTTSAVIVLDENHPLVLKKKTKFEISIKRAASSCCQCRTCTDLCPRHALGHPIEPHMFMRSAANQDFSSVKPFVNTMFCSSCGLCEMYSCPQGLSPRTMMAEYKAGLRKAGVKAPKVAAEAVNPARAYRQVPEGRLMARLGLSNYDAPAKLDDGLREVKKVRILLSQHIGAPATAIVNKGNTISKNDLIAKAGNGLSVNIHASIDGVVTEVTDKYIEISKDR